MSGEMVERVARAMAEMAYREAMPNMRDLNPWIESNLKSYLPIARAAIAEMREPTEGMANRGREAEFLPGEFAFDEIGAPSNADKETWAKIGVHHHPGYETSTWQNAGCAGVWRAMIDEALR